jgi:heme-degrading monooxygenase HmoA
MIAEVHRTSGFGGTVADLRKAFAEDSSISERALNAPGSVELMTLANDAGDGLAVHLWESKEAYEAWASERAEVTAKAKAAIGVTIAEAEIYEVLQLDGPAQTKGPGGLAEVHRLSGGAFSREPNKMALEAAAVPGTEELLGFGDETAGMGMVLHIWRDRESYDAFARRRGEMTAEAEQSGQKVGDTEMYEVVYRAKR